MVQVREPYERLLSAYRFTFQNKNRNRNNLQVTRSFTSFHLAFRVELGIIINHLDTGTS